MKEKVHRAERGRRHKLEVSSLGSVLGLVASFDLDLTPNRTFDRLSGVSDAGQWKRSSDPNAHFQVCVPLQFPDLPLIDR